MFVFLIMYQVEKRPVFDLLPRRRWNTGLKLHRINTSIRIVLIDWLCQAYFISYHFIDKKRNWHSLV
jgi:hypothetical protein